MISDEEKKEYEDFVLNNERCHFAQSLTWAELKKGWEKEIVTVRDDNGKIKGSVLLLIRKMPITHNFTVITKECQRFRYPPDFTAASNKTIKVLNADLVIIDGDSIIRPRGLTLHSDFVQNELMVIGEVNRENSPFSSSFVCCINDTISVPRVFPQYNQAMEFKIWIVH